MTMTTGNRPSAEINITPMIDILLVLLIIFMAIAPVPPKGLEALLPRPPKSDSTPAEDLAVVLQILRTNNGGVAYKINQTLTGREEIRGKLQGIFSTRPTKVMFVKADKDLDFSPVAWSIDVARSAGVDHIGLVTPGIARSR